MPSGVKTGAQRELQPGDLARQHIMICPNELHLILEQQSYLNNFSTVRFLDSNVARFQKRIASPSRFR